MHQDYPSEIRALWHQNLLVGVMDSHVRTKTDALVLTYVLAYPESQRPPADRHTGPVPSRPLPSPAHDSSTLGVCCVADSQPSTTTTTVATGRELCLVSLGAVPPFVPLRYPEYRTYSNYVGTVARFHLLRTRSASPTLAVSR